MREFADGKVIFLFPFPEKKSVHRKQAIDVLHLQVIPSCCQEIARYFYHLNHRKPNVIQAHASSFAGDSRVVPEVATTDV
jgi:hypothetical protein